VLTLDTVAGVGSILKADITPEFLGTIMGGFIISDSSIFSESLSNSAKSSVPSADTSSVEKAVDTVDGVPIAVKLCRPPGSMRSAYRGMKVGLIVVALAVDAAEHPSSSRSFPSEFA